jgi:putative toxin-antitoxin system antitoxin component (TIGR02293 family)
MKKTEAGRNQSRQPMSASRAKSLAGSLLSSGKWVAREPRTTKMFSFKSVSEGVSSVAVRDLEGIGLRREDIRQIIPDRTLERRIASGENLRLEEADGLARLLRVVLHARRVFEDDALADEWLRTPNPALDNLIPIQMARTDLGGREVEAVLLRLEHGVFS